MKTRLVFALLLSLSTQYALSQTSDPKYKVKVKNGVVRIQDKSKPVPTALEAEYAKMRQAYVDDDPEPVIATRAPDYSAVLPEGGRWTREDAVAYIRAGFDQSRAHHCTFLRHRFARRARGHRDRQHPSAVEADAAEGRQAAEGRDGSVSTRMVAKDAGGLALLPCRRRSPRRLENRRQARRPQQAVRSDGTAVRTLTKPPIVLA